MPSLTRSDSSLCPFGWSAAHSGTPPISTPFGTGATPSNLTLPAIEPALAGSTVAAPAGAAVPAPLEAAGVPVDEDVLSPPPQPLHAVSEARSAKEHNDAD